MTGLDLRPLSLGEILDRTFSLYKRHFLLFVGIAAIPNVINLAAALMLGQNPNSIGVRSAALTIVFGLVMAILGLIVYIFAQGGTILALTDLYLGRTTSIANSLKRIWPELGSLFGVIFLNGLVTLAAALLLVIPGIYVGCRLLVCMPAAVVERRTPRDSLSRSWNLTRDYAGRAFLIFLIFTVLSVGIGELVDLPFTRAISIAKTPEVLRFWSALLQIVNSVVNIFISPILLIATSLFYFDLRVRKEAFDLQFMMDPTSEHLAGPGSGSVPSILG